VNAVGGVNVIYGSSTGLTATADQNFDETTFGFPYHSLRLGSCGGRLQR
jgi:hypothetical protein